MSEPIYDELLAQFIRKHGHLPGERRSKRPVGLFKKTIADMVSILGPRP